MTSNEFNTTYFINEESTFDDSTYNSECYTNFKNFAKNNPALTTGLAAASVVATASIISPKIRKMTAPVCKYALKQQLKLLAGIGILSIANTISNQSNLFNDIDNTDLQ